MFIENFNNILILQFIKGFLHYNMKKKLVKICTIYIVKIKIEITITIYIENGLDQFQQN